MNSSPCHFSTVPLSPSSTFKYSCSPLFPFFAFPPFSFFLIYFIHLLSFLSLPYSFPPPSLLSFSLLFTTSTFFPFFSLPYSFLHLSILSFPYLLPPDRDKQPPSTLSLFPETDRRCSTSPNLVAAALCKDTRGLEKLLMT